VPLNKKPKRASQRSGCEPRTLARKKKKKEKKLGSGQKKSREKEARLGGGYRRKKGRGTAVLRVSVNAGRNRQKEGKQTRAFDPEKKSGKKHLGGEKTDNPSDFSSAQQEKKRKKKTSLKTKNGLKKNASGSWGFRLSKGEEEKKKESRCLVSGERIARSKTKREKKKPQKKKKKTPPPQKKKKKKKKKGTRLSLAGRLRVCPRRKKGVRRTPRSCPLSPCQEKRGGAAGGRNGKGKPFPTAEKKRKRKTRIWVATKEKKKKK